VKKTTDQKTQTELQETVDHSSEEMDQKIGDLDRIQEDVQTIRETLENLDFAGTSDGSDAVEQSMNEADDKTVEVFDQEDQKLDEVQQGNNDLEGEMTDYSDAGQGDLDKVSDASTRIETQEAVSALLEVKETALKELDFLAQQIERAKQSREASEQRQQEFQNNIRSKGGS
jgi:hypothetical protein